MAVSRFALELEKQGGNSIPLLLLLFSFPGVPYRKWPALSRLRLVRNRRCGVQKGLPGDRAQPRRSAAVLHRRRKEEA